MKMTDSIDTEIAAGKLSKRESELLLLLRSCGDPVKAFETAIRVIDEQLAKADGNSNGHLDYPKVSQRV